MIYRAKKQYQSNIAVLLNIGENAKNRLQILVPQLCFNARQRLSGRIAETYLAVKIRRRCQFAFIPVRRV
jgi:hypothetical protein